MMGFHGMLRDLITEEIKFVILFEREFGKIGMTRGTGEKGIYFNKTFKLRLDPDKGKVEAMGDATGEFTPTDTLEFSGGGWVANIEQSLQRVRDLLVAQKSEGHDIPDEYYFQAAEAGGGATAFKFDTLASLLKAVANLVALKKNTGSAEAALLTIRDVSFLKKQQGFENFR